MVSSNAMINLKEIKRAEIEMETELFKRKGGNVKVIENKYTEKPKPIAVYGVYSYMQEKRKKAQKVTRRKSNKKHKYIQVKDGGRKPQVIICGKYIGSFDNLDLAIEARDKWLIDHNIPPVED